MENSTDYEYLLQKSYFNLTFGCTVLIIIVGIVGVVGNLSIIIFYFFRIKDRGERYFIPLLAIVDLLACVANSAYIFTDNTYYYNYPSDFACKINCMLRLFFSGISALVFLLISVQRYVLICKPFRPKMTLFWKRLSFASACGIVMAGTAPILWKSGIRTSKKTYMDTNVTVHMCTFSVEYSSGTMVYFALLLFAILICIIATISLYIPVLKQVNMSVRLFRSTIQKTVSESENSALTEMKCVVVSNLENIEMRSMAATDASDASEIQLPDPKTSQVHPVNSNVAYAEKICDDHPSDDTFQREQCIVKDKSKSGKRKRRQKRETVQRRLTMMFFLLILICIISYIPPLVILVLTYSIEDFNVIKLSETETLIWIYAPHVRLLNHVINPFIYGYYDTQFREQLISCFKRGSRAV